MACAILMDGGHYPGYLGRKKWGVVGEVLDRSNLGLTNIGEQGLIFDGIERGYAVGLLAADAPLVEPGLLLLLWPPICLAFSALYDRRQRSLRSRNHTCQTNNNLIYRRLAYFCSKIFSDPSSNTKFILYDFGGGHAELRTIASINIIEAVYIYTIRKVVLTPQWPHYPSSCGYIIVTEDTMASSQPHGSSS